MFFKLFLKINCTDFMHIVVVVVVEECLNEFMTLNKIFLIEILNILYMCHIHVYNVHTYMFKETNLLQIF